MSVVLALDTSGPVLSTAVAEIVATSGGDIAIGGVVHAADYDNGGDHAETLPILVQQSLRDAGCGSKWQQRVRAILIGEGPGSFTGLRIGFSFAKGLAHGLDIPLFRGDTFLGAAVGALLRERGACQISARSVGINQLRDAADLPDSSDEGSDLSRVLVVRDARRQEVFAAIFRCRRARYRADQLEVDEPLAIRPLSEIQNLVKGITGKAPGTIPVVVDSKVNHNSVWYLVADEDLSFEIPAGKDSLGLSGMTSFANVAEGILRNWHGKIIGGGEPLAEVQPRYLRAMAALTVAERQEARALKMAVKI